MKRQLSFAEYRTIDLFLFGIMLAFSETVITLAATRWFPGQPFSVSISAAMCAIVLMRWGPYAAIHAVLGGAVLCAVSGATPQQYVIYCVGNLACLLSLVLIRLIGGENIRKNVVLSMVFAVCTLLFMQLGRAGVALALGTDPANWFGFITTDALSGLFAMVIIYTVRNLDGVFEDQKRYLIRIQEKP